MQTSVSATPSPTPGLAWLPALASHALLLMVVYAALYSFGILTTAPTAKTLISWDAGWFNSVRTNGYEAGTGQTNIPFFPLFPYLWRLSGLNGLGISIVNACFMFLGSVWLGRTFSLSRQQLLVLLATPPLFFCLVPYAEGLFFLFGAVLLHGLHRRHLAFTILGLLGCCLTRSAATLFIPAFVFAELLACTSRAEVSQFALRLLTGLLAIAAALGIVMYMHFLATGDAFALFNSYQHWGHEMRWPPAARLFSSAGLPMLGLDLLAMLASSLAVVACLWLGIRWLRSWWQPQAVPAPSRAVVFSLGYCVGVFAFMVLYQEGDLSNSSRYVLGTPFFAVLLLQLSAWQRLTAGVRWVSAGIALALVIALAMWCGWPARMPGFFPGEATFFFAAWLGYLLCYVAAFTTNRYGRDIRIGLYVVNTIYQIILLNLFIGGAWMG
ncbi:hypothetical protein Q5H93_10120 [Hymenobacter sp. ASUV-10]|uniref:Glycosyltransferase RgtA/B/C/D-like domain-containing protein n=1 Tax=Hymenobacter aranciens TaxID=3063996 RepID=A0ABT9B9Z1_9BACT|nr:hypothetical protein [Hymenobacter sp. ASUV-10]MDO7875086.1 hypothetical protein [Hymenobacter sp. ASUV-10]